jgi:hypothetical protein
VIEQTSGDVFSANVDALVNAVNTVGVMGKVWHSRSRSGSRRTSRRTSVHATRAT